MLVFFFRVNMPPKDTNVKRKDRVIWSEEDWNVLNEIVNNTKTKSGVAMTRFLENSNPKHNHKLSQ